MYFVPDGPRRYLDFKDSPLYANAHYPRLKQLKDGRFLLLFQDGTHGGAIYRAFSDDLREWSEPKAIIAPYHYRMADGTADIRLFMTEDAAVLENGDILMVSSFRAKENYSKRVEENGVVAYRSTDGGVTWTPPTVIYTGTNWEPHILVLKSGEIHVYFTMTAPKIYLHGFNTSRRSSGVGLVRSLDGGHTWVPQVSGPPYAAQRVMQQYVMELDGVSHFTDQMPVGAELKDGSIAVAVESFAADRTYSISLGYTHDNWADNLDINATGPRDRLNSIRSGAGPYLVTLDSGLTALSYNTKKDFFLCAGDETAHHFDPPVKVFGDFFKGFWGSLCSLPGERVAACFPQVTDTGNNGIGIQVLKLNKKENAEVSSDVSQEALGHYFG